MSKSLRQLLFAERNEILDQTGRHGIARKPCWRRLLFARSRPRLPRPVREGHRRDWRKQSRSGVPSRMTLIWSGVMFDDQPTAKAPPANVAGRADPKGFPRTGSAVLYEKPRCLITQHRGRVCKRSPAKQTLPSRWETMSCDDCAMSPRWASGRMPHHAADINKIPGICAARCPRQQHGRLPPRATTLSPLSVSATSRGCVEEKPACRGRRTKAAQQKKPSAHYGLRAKGLASR